MRVLTSTAVALVLLLPVPSVAGLVFAVLTVAHGLVWTRSVHAA